LVTAALPNAAAIISGRDLERRDQPSPNRFGLSFEVAVESL
jgi:hypothetical protein